MTKVIAPTAYPCLRFADAEAALVFLTKAFGFEELVVYRAPETNMIVHAELTLGNGVLMMGQLRNDPKDVTDRAPGNTIVYFAVPDAEAHYRRAREAGAEIAIELEDHGEGSIGYSARDPEGNLWSFGTYQPVPKDLG